VVAASNSNWLKTITYDIWPNGAKASRRLCVSASGLRSPTKIWKCSTKKTKPTLDNIYQLSTTSKNQR